MAYPTAADCDFPVCWKRMHNSSQWEVVSASAHWLLLCISFESADLVLQCNGVAAMLERRSELDPGVSLISPQNKPRPIGASLRLFSYWAGSTLGSKACPPLS